MLSMLQEKLHNFLDWDFNRKVINLSYFLIAIFFLTIYILPKLSGISLLLLGVLAWIYFFKNKIFNRIDHYLSIDEKRLFFVIILFSAFQIFSAFFQPEGYQMTLDEKLKALDYPLRWLYILPSIFLMKEYNFNKKTLIVSFTLGLIVASIFSLIQFYFLGMNRPIGFFNHNLPFAELIAIGNIITLAYLHEIKDQGFSSLRFYLLTASVISLISILHSGSRGVILSYLGILLIHIVRTIFKSNNINKKRFLLKKSYLVTLLLVAVSFFNSPAYDLTRDRFNETIHEFSKNYKVSEHEGFIKKYNFNKALGGRVEIYEDSLDSIIIHPFGVGTNNFPSIDLDNKEINHAHNEILNLSVEAGVHTASLYLVILFLLLRIYIKSKKRDENIKFLANSGLILVFSYFMFGLTQTLLSHNITLLFFIFLNYFFLSQLNIMSSKKN